MAIRQARIPVAPSPKLRRRENHRAGRFQFPPARDPQHFRAIGGDVAPGRHHDPDAAIEHRPLREAREAAEQQAIVLQQIGGPDGLAVAFQVARACHDNPPDLAEPHGNQFAVRQRPHADRHIDLIRDRIDAAVADGEIDGDFGKALGEFRQQLGQLVSGECGPRVQTEVSARPSVRGGDRGFSGFDGAQYASRMGQKCLAFLRQHQSALWFDAAVWRRDGFPAASRCGRRRRRSVRTRRRQRQRSRGRPSAQRRRCRTLGASNSMTNWYQ